MERVERGNSQLIEWWNRPYAGSDQLVDCDEDYPELTVTDPAGEVVGSTEDSVMEKGTGTGYFYLTVQHTLDDLTGWYNCRVKAVTSGKIRYGYFGYEVV